MTKHDSKQGMGKRLDSGITVAMMYATKLVVFSVNTTPVFYFFLIKTITRTASV